MDFWAVTTAVLLLAIVIAFAVAARFFWKATFRG